MPKKLQIKNYKQMKRKIFILTALIFSLKIFSQETQEVEDWIKEKTTKYYYLNDESTPKRFVYFRDNNLIYGISNYDNSNFNTTTTLEKIKISEIKKVEIKKIYIDRDIWIINLYCAKDKKCVNERIEYHFSKTFDTKELNYVSMGYNSKFGEDNLPNRMGKALTDLIKLYGGTAILIVKKEKY